MKTLALDILYLKFLTTTKKKSSGDVKQTIGYLDLELKIKGWILNFSSHQYIGGI